MIPVMENIEVIINLPRVKSLLISTLGYQPSWDMGLLELEGSMSTFVTGTALPR